jgi:regulator of protease activity HflC (stomatin/prohibitin superfamily)
MSRSDWLQLVLKILGAAWHLILRQVQQHPWAVAVALYGLARAFGVMIQSGQRGVLFRWGKAVKELEPGFHWLIPLVHGVKKTPVRSVTIHVPGQKVMTVDGLVYDVSVSVVYRVEDATRALTLVDHVNAGCRAAIPIVVAEVLRVRDQAQLVERVSLDRELSERMGAWIARWGLVVEQAGFTTIAPDKGVLQTTQLRSRTRERARAWRDLIDGGLDAESALVMIGTERQPVAKSSRPYHTRTRQPGQATRARRAMQKIAVATVAANSTVRN